VSRRINEVVPRQILRLGVSSEFCLYQYYLRNDRLMNQLTNWPYGQFVNSPRPGSSRCTWAVHMDFILDRPIEIAHFHFSATPAFNRIKIIPVLLQKQNGLSRGPRPGSTYRLKPPRSFHGISMHGRQWRPARRAWTRLKRRVRSALAWSPIAPSLARIGQAVRRRRGLE
jgi:hypothetical protein